MDALKSIIMAEAVSDFLLYAFLAGFAVWLGAYLIAFGYLPGMDRYAKKRAREIARQTWDVTKVRLTPGCAGLKLERLRPIQFHMAHPDYFDIAQIPKSNKIRFNFHAWTHQGVSAKHVCAYLDLQK